MKKEREFCNEVRKLAEKYKLPFFVVTKGASAVSNNGCEAVRVARLNHEKWELSKGFDPKEDWGKNEKDMLLYK